jgi:hypothetical protein
MSDETMLTKAELFDLLSDIELYPELRADFSAYMGNFINHADTEAVARLLAAGASPTSSIAHDDYLYILYHQYQVNRTLRGDTILRLMEMLLSHGADPNRIIDNNLRVYDLASGHGENEVRLLLVKYGAERQLRKVL